MDFEDCYIKYTPRDKRTKICTCRGINTKAVKEAINSGAFTYAHIKQRTGIGYGICKGKFCARKVADLLKEAGALPYQQKENQ